MVRHTLIIKWFWLTDLQEVCRYKSRRSLVWSIQWKETPHITLWLGDTGSGPNLAPWMCCFAARSYCNQHWNWLYDISHEQHKTTRGHALTIWPDSVLAEESHCSYRADPAYTADSHLKAQETLKQTRSKVTPPGLRHLLYLLLLRPWSVSLLTLVWESDVW